MASSTSSSDDELQGMCRGGCSPQRHSRKRHALLKVQSTSIVSFQYYCCREVVSDCVCSCCTFAVPFRPMLPLGIHLLCGVCLQDVVCLLPLIAFACPGSDALFDESTSEVECRAGGSAFNAKRFRSAESISTPHTRSNSKPHDTKPLQLIYNIEQSWWSMCQ